MSDHEQVNIGILNNSDQCNEKDAAFLCIRH